MVRARIFFFFSFWIAVGILAIIWWSAPHIINAGFDMNLALIKWVCGELPPPYGDRIESFMRFFNFEKMFLISETSFVLGGIVYAFFPSLVGRK